MVKCELPNPTSSCESIHSSMLGKGRACRVVRDDSFDEFDRSGSIAGWLDGAVSYITGWPTKEGSSCLDQKKQNSKQNPVVGWKLSKNQKPKRTTARKGANDSMIEGVDDSMVESGEESMYCATTTSTTSSVENDDGSHSSSAASSSESSDDSTISIHVKPKMKTILIPMATSPKTVTSTCSSISASTHYHSTVSSPTGAQQHRHRHDTAKRASTYQSVVVIDLTDFSDLSNNNAPSIETAAAAAETYEKDVVPDVRSKIRTASPRKARKNPVKDSSKSPVAPESTKKSDTSASPQPIIPSPSMELAPSAKQPRSRHGRREDPPASSANPTSPGDKLKNSEKKPTVFRYGSPEKARRDRSPEKQKAITRYNLPACPSGGEEQRKTTEDKLNVSQETHPVEKKAREPAADVDPPNGESTSTTSTASLLLSSSNDTSEEEEGKETPLHSLSSHTTTHNTSHSVGSSRDKSFPTTMTAPTSNSSTGLEPEKNRRERQRRRRSAKKYAMDDCKPIIPRKNLPTSRPKNPYFSKLIFS